MIEKTTFKCTLNTNWGFQFQSQNHHSKCWWPNISTFLIISSFFCFFVYIQDLTFWRKLGTSMGLWHSTTTRISKAIFPNIFKGCRSHTTMKYISFIFQPDIDIGQLTRVKPVFLYLVGRFGAKHTLESFYNFNLQHLKTSLLANPWRGIQKNKVYIFVRMLTDKNISLDIQNRKFELVAYLDRNSSLVQILRLRMHLKW